LSSEQDGRRGAPSGAGDRSRGRTAMTPAELRALHATLAVRETFRILETLEPKLVAFAPTQETAIIVLDRAQVDVLRAMVTAAREQLAPIVAALEVEP
jgi:hypothetical protein